MFISLPEINFSRGFFFCQSEVGFVQKEGDDNMFPLFGILGIIGFVQVLEGGTTPIRSRAEVDKSRRLVDEVDEEDAVDRFLKTQNKDVSLMVVARLIPELIPRILMMDKVGQKFKDFKTKLVKVTEMIENYLSLGGQDFFKVLFLITQILTVLYKLCYVPMILTKSLDVYEHYRQKKFREFTVENVYNFFVVIIFFLGLIGTLYSIISGFTGISVSILAFFSFLSRKVI